MLLTFPDMVFGDSISRVHTAKYHAAKSRFVIRYLRGWSSEQIALSRNGDRNGSGWHMRVKKVWRTVRAYLCWTRLKRTCLDLHVSSPFLPKDLPRTLRPTCVGPNNPLSFLSFWEATQWGFWHTWNYELLHRYWESPPFLYFVPFLCLTNLCCAPTASKRTQPSLTSWIFIHIPTQAHPPHP